MNERGNGKIRRIHKLTMALPKLKKTYLIVFPVDVVYSLLRSRRRRVPFQLLFRILRRTKWKLFPVCFHPFNVHGNWVSCQAHESILMKSKSETMCMLGSVSVDGIPGVRCTQRCIRSVACCE